MTMAKVDDSQGLSILGAFNLNFLATVIFEKNEYHFENFG